MRTSWMVACFSVATLAATALVPSANSGALMALDMHEWSAQSRAPTVTCETRRRQCLAAYTRRGPLTGVPSVPGDKVRLCYQEYRQCMGGR
jgi:hypothetical protein